MGTTNTEQDPLWYKDALIYELHVRAFFDSNSDGVGDFAGLTDKLDYLQDLGVTALWLLPFYPSPQRDDGYDIADFRGIHPSYGTMRDFKRFLKAAHHRDLKVITELVINHTSSDHPWFQRARKAAPESPQRDYYVWTQDPGRYSDARVIFKDFETSNWAWDSVANAYFWHRFYSHQPDLNFDNARVQRAVLEVADYWLEMGVDGLRLDAVPYLFEREGTGSENLEQTHAFLRKLRAHVDRNHPARMLLAEANQWPEEAAAYFGAGDECHMNFHFPLMPRLFMALHLEDSRPIIDILERTPHLGASCQWALFLRNHDELTLEMVTDEERDYMYRAYASESRTRINLGIRRRLAPLLRLRRKIELMNGLLFSLPGTPVIYYGDEIGMGDNPYLGDRDGVRTPMQWSGDRNAGFSRANPQALYLPPITDPEYHYEAINVEAQARNPSSLLSWTRNLIQLRRQYAVFGRGSIEFVETNNSRMLAFVREYRGQRMLVAANLSRFMQYGRLELRRSSGLSPVEVFGHNVFPTIGNEPYFLSLGPHGFCWFELVEHREGGLVTAPGELEVPADWRQVLVAGRTALEQILRTYVRERRWFRSKSHVIRSVSIVDSIELPNANAEVVLIRVDYQDREPERYVLPLSFAAGGAALELQQQYPPSVVSPMVVGGRERGVLFDATVSPEFAWALLDATRSRAALRGQYGVLRSSALSLLRQLRPDELRGLTVRVGNTEQSNTSLILGERLILKLFRRVEEGVNPDVEFGRFFGKHPDFSRAPKLAGFVEYERGGHGTATFSMVQEFVHSESDGWQHTLSALFDYLERCESQPFPRSNFVLDASLLERSSMPLPRPLAPLLDPYLPQAELLARRTAEMHRALASDPDDPDFQPEELTNMDQRSLYESARARAARGFELLGRHLSHLAPDAVERARALLSKKEELDDRLEEVLATRIEALRIRCHGDFHLGQVLYTGQDFVIIDFEGEPARPLSERRFKKSPLVDVAGMLRSYHYAATAALGDERWTSNQRARLEPWTRAWHAWVTARYLGSYLDTVAGSDLLPSKREQLRVLLDFLVIDKCLYEIVYELDARPNWVRIPLEGLYQILTQDRIR